MATETRVIIVDRAKVFIFIPPSTFKANPYSLNMDTEVTGYIDGLGFVIDEMEGKLLAVRLAETALVSPPVEPPASAETITWQPGHLQMLDADTGETWTLIDAPATFQKEG